VSKAVKDLKSMANAKKAASAIKNNILSIGKGFRVIWFLYQFYFI